MLYIGNFSYADQDEQAESLCTMPAIVEAKSADDALERFGELLRSLRQSQPILSGAREIYLDSLVELDQAPTDAVLVQWHKIVQSEEGPYDVACALPAKEEGAREYTWDGSAAREVSEEALRINLVDDVDIEGEFDPCDEDVEPADVESIADALVQAFEALSSNDLSAFDDEELSAADQPFLTFDD